MDPIIPVENTLYVRPGLRQPHVGEGWLAGWKVGGEASHRGGKGGSGRVEHGVHHRGFAIKERGKGEAGGGFVMPLLLSCPLPGNSHIVLILVFCLRT